MPPAHFGLHGHAEDVLVSFEDLVANRYHSLYRRLGFRNRGDDLADVGAVDNTGDGELFASLADILGFLDGALDQIGEFASRRAALGLDALGASRGVPAPRKGDKGFFN